MAGLAPRRGTAAVPTALLLLALSSTARAQVPSASAPPLPDAADAAWVELVEVDAEPAPSAAPPPPPAPSASASIAVPAPSAPPAPPPPSASATAPSAEPSPVRLGDSTVFEVRVGHGKESAKARADAATAALKTVLPGDEVRVEERAESAVIYAGKTPIIELWAEDARAHGEESPKDHAARVAAQVKESLRREQKRSAIANTVFSLSLLVAAALFAIYLLRKVSEFTARARDYVVTHPDRIPALKVYSLEVVNPAALRSALVVGFGALRTVAQITLVYLWLLGSLSLFDTTKPYTQKLTGLVVSPITGLLGRVVATIPMLVVTALALVAVLVVLRFVALFFGSVARGETRVDWLPAPLAGPTSLLLRMGIVAATLVFAAPVVTGDAEGALARSGMVLVAALGLSATPLFATALAGAAVLYSRRLSPGDEVRVGSRSGRVEAVGLLDVTLVTEAGTRVRVPHLLFFFETSEVVASAEVAVVEIAIAPGQDGVSLSELFAGVAEGARAELVHADADGLSFRVSAPALERSELLQRVLDRLRERGVRLGRRRGAEVG